MPTSLTRNLTLLMGVRGSKAVNTALRGVQTNLTKVGKIAKAASKAATVAIGGIGIAIAGAVTASISFESAFAGVIKTVDEASDKFGNLTDIGKQLRKEIIDLSKEIPISANELAGIAEVAGQLGIKAKDLTQFTSVIAKLAETTNIVGTEGALDLARFLNITGTATSEVENLGSAIVDLGNNFATQERDILSAASRMAALSSAVGVSTADILAFATAASASGAEAEVAGSTFQRMGLKIQKAAQVGGSELEEFARISGVTGEQFKQTFERDAGDAIVLFLQGIEKTVKGGENLDTILKSVGLSNIRFTTTIAQVIGKIGILEAARKKSNEALIKGTALQKEFEIRAKTTAAKLEILKNKIVAVAIELGDKFLDPLIKVTTKITDWFIANKDLIISLGKFILIAAITIKIGFFVIAIGKMIIALNALTLAFGLSPAGLVVGGVLLAIGLVIAGMKAMQREADKTQRSINEMMSKLRAQKELPILIEFEKLQKIQKVGPLRSVFGSAEFVGANTIERFKFLKAQIEGAKSAIEEFDRVRKASAAAMVKEEITAKSFRKLEEPPIPETLVPESSEFDVFDLKLINIKDRLRDMAEAASTVTEKVELFDLVFKSAFNKEFTQEIFAGLLNSLDTFAEKLQFVGEVLRKEIGFGAQLAFKTFEGAAKGGMKSIEAQSKAFFKGENERLLSFGLLTQNIWQSVKASALEAISSELKFLGEKWAIQSIAAFASGNFPAGAGFAAAAAAAGVASSVAAGAAAATREQFNETLAAGTGQQSPLTPEEQSAGVTRPATAGASTIRGSITQSAQRNITIAPSTTFNNTDGGILIIGSSGLEEAGEVLGDIIAERVKEMFENGEV